MRYFFRSILPLFLCTLTSVTSYAEGYHAHVIEDSGIHQVYQGTIVGVHIVYHSYEGGGRDGQLIGGVTGALVGSTFGRGAGRGVGAVVGGIVGSNIGHELGERKEYVQACEYQVELLSGERILLVQKANPLIGMGSKVLVIVNPRGRAFLQLA